MIQWLHKTQLYKYNVEFMKEFAFLNSIWKLVHFSEKWQQFRKNDF